MTITFRQQIHDLLKDLPNRKLDSLKQLFWTELNYDLVNESLSMRDWPETASDNLTDPPTLFATAGNEDGFHIIYSRLKSERLWLGHERQVINQLLSEHPFALFIFSTQSQTHWHFVNVKYEHEQASSRRVFRRITIGPEERLRTATERISLLDISMLSPDLFGISPLAIQQQHDEAFDVEKVTKEFFGDYRKIFEQVENQITGILDNDRRIFTQLLFNRMLFIVFLERKGWLTFQGRRDYLRALWEAHSKEKSQGEPVNFYRDRLKLLFFSGLNTQHEVNIVGINPQGFLQTRIGQVPYLNGGLFEEDALDRDNGINISDTAISLAIEDLLYHYNFTVTESTPLDIEVAVDPEMLGRIFEELVTGRHESGSYYTPKPVVAFMCREALKGYLSTECPQESEAVIEKFVDEREAGGIGNPEIILKSLKTIRACDPACGSGAYLLGMMHELLDLRKALFVSKRLDPKSVYERKLEIIQRSVYGVDNDPFAVNIARLRLWLSLIVDFEGDHPPPLPNLDFKIGNGDSLTAPDPSGGLQPDLFRYKQIRDFVRLKDLYLSTHGSEKTTLKKRIDKLKAEIAEWAHPGDEQPGFDWVVEFVEVFANPNQKEIKKPGFDVVLANPPYVRADAQYKHIKNETERQYAIAKWKIDRQQLKKSKIYTTLYEKWDLYIPFLERAWQLLCPGGQMVFIIPDAYNAAKYAQKSQDFFLRNSWISRVDFCSEIPLFKAGIYNTIIHFIRTKLDESEVTLRFRRWGDRPDDFEENIETLPTAPQAIFGRALFRPDGQKPMEMGKVFIPLIQICYISKGMVIHAEEKKYLGAFKTEDLISPFRDKAHPKRFSRGKELMKWIPKQIWFLEWGTERAPRRFSRPTFPELHETKEKLIAVRTPGVVPRVIFDSNNLYFDASSVGFIPWFSIRGVINRSINKTAKYRSQSPDGDREIREQISQQFKLKYLLAIMNSSFACKWLNTGRRRSNKHIYPDDWKKLPIPPIPLDEQDEFVRIVNTILTEFQRHKYPLPTDVSTRVAELERELDENVSALYRATVSG